MFDPASGRARPQSLVREPDGQASPLAQAGIVLGPVRHSMPLLADGVTASGIGLEGHGGIFAQKPNRPLRYPAPVPNLLIQATRRHAA
jgi:hypothetical protein